MHSDNRCRLKARKLVTAGFLHRYDTGNEGFLSQNITGDETWIQHSQPESTRQSMEWRHTTSPCNKKFKSAQSAGKSICAVFWDDKGVVLVNVLLRETAVIFPVYWNTKKFAWSPSAFEFVPQEKCPKYGSPRQLQATHKCAHHLDHHKIRMDSVPAAVYSPDHVSWDLNFSCSLKDSRQGCLDGDDEELQNLVHQWL